MESNDIYEPTQETSDCSIEKTEKKSKLKNRLSWKEILEKIPATATYYFAFITLGFYYSVSGLTLSLLSEYLSVSESKIGLLITFRGLGLIPSSIICGFVFKFVQRNNFPDEVPIRSGGNFFKGFIYYKIRRFFKLSVNKIIIFSLYGVAITLVLTPFVPYFWVSCILFFVQGFFTSFIEIGCYVCFSNIWGEYVDPITQGVICVFLLGCFVFPMVLAQIFTFVQNSYTQLTSAYLICASMVYIPSVWLLTLVETPMDRNNVDGNLKKDDVKKKKIPIKKTLQIAMKSLFSLKNLILFLVGLLKLFGVGTQIGFFSFIFLFGNRKSLDTEANLSYMMSVVYIVGVFSSFIVSVAAIVITPVYIVSVVIFFSTTIFLFWTIFVNSKVMMWIGSIAFGIVSAPLNAVLLSLPLVNYKIPLDEFSASFILLMQYCGEMGFPTLMSLLSDEKVLGPNGYVYIAFGGFLVTFGTFIITIVVGCFYNRRNKKKGTISNDKIRRKIDKNESCPNNEEEIEGENLSDHTDSES